MTHSEQPWTASQVSALKRLWMKTDLTASEIALKHHKEVGDRTRNAILGKVHRMKLPMRCPENSHPGSHRDRLVGRLLRLVNPGQESQRQIMDEGWTRNDN